MTCTGTIPSKCLRRKFHSVCGWARPVSSVARARIVYCPGSLTCHRYDHRFHSHLSGENSMCASCQVLPSSHAHFDPDDLALAAPGQPADRVRADFKGRIIVFRLGDDALAAERRHHLLVRVVRRLARHEIVRLVIAIGHPVHHFDLVDPLDPPVAGPARDDEAQRRAMHVLQIFAVVRPGQDRVGMHRLGDGEAFVVVDDARIEHREVRARRRPVDGDRVGATAVPSLETNGHRTGLDAGALQHLAERHAGPFAAADHAGAGNGLDQRVGIGDGLLPFLAAQPPVNAVLFADVERRLLPIALLLDVVEEIGVVARALDHRAHRASRHLAQVLQRERHRRRHFAEERERVVVRMHGIGHLDLGVDERVVGGRDQALEVEERRAGADHAPFGVLVEFRTGPFSIRPSQHPVALHLFFRRHRYPFADQSRLAHAAGALPDVMGLRSIFDINCRLFVAGSDINDRARAGRSWRRGRGAGRRFGQSVD